MGNRHKLYCTVAAAALLAALNGAATAADMPVKASPAPVVSATNWSGFYLGGHIGYGWTKMSGDESGDALTGDLKLNGVLAGVHGGYNFQYGQVVFGVEGDVSGAFGNSWAASANTIECCSASGMHGAMQGVATLRGRLGWAFDRTLIYATGGVAWGQFSGDIQSASSFDPSHKVNAIGGVVGGGVEWKYNPNLSFRVEGLHYMFNKTVAVGSESGDGGFTIHPVNVVRVGASYHF
jgi:outer membrane immunogenic protein